MAKVKNKKTGVIKNIEKEFEVSMYLGTGEWELVEEKRTNPLQTPIIDAKEKDEK